MSARTRTLLGTGALLTTLLLGMAPASGATPATTLPAGCTSGTACFLDARTGAHTGYDRLVFDVSLLPQVQSSSISTSGSYDYNDNGTKYVSITGNDYLFVNFADASLFSNTGLAYTTPNPEAIDLPAIKGVQYINDDEGSVSFALSLNSYTSYDIFTLTAPDRVVIDVYH